MKQRHVLAAAAAAVVAATGLVPPAHAATRVVVDGDDSDAAVDLLRTRVTHGPKRVKVKMVHEDLVRNGIKVGQSVSVWLDTDPDDPGPEYRFLSGLNAGTDYVLQKVNRWQGPGKRLTCAHRFVIDWKKDVAVLRIGRGCLGNPDAVAVAVKAEELGHEGQAYVDWLTKPRQFTPAVARG